ncbi:MAG: hypothetical protein ACI8PT_004546 [Gammaproteobacteria bacterium]|jgi:uncharacterized protein YdgA (DUF945 family)
MKKLGLGIGFVILELLALPYIFGWYAEREIRAHVEATAFASQIDMSFSKYVRGWFRSEAVLEVGFAKSYIEQLRAVSAQGGGDSTPFEGPATMRYSAQFDIVHGPLLRTKDLKLGLVEAVSKLRVDAEDVRAMLAQSGAEQLLETYAYIDFSGLTHFTSSSPALKWTHDLGQFDVEPLVVTGTYESSTREISMRGLLPRVQVDTPEVQIELGVMSMDGSLRFISSYLYVGDVQVSLATIRANGSSGGPFTMDGLKVSTSVSESAGGQALDMGVQYSVKNALFDDTRVAHVVLGLQLENIDRVFLEEYTKLAQDPAALARLGSPEGFGELQELLHKFLVRSPHLSIKPLSFVMDGETSNLEIDVRVNGAKLPGAHDLSPENLLVIRETLNAAGSVDLGKELALTIAKARMKQNVIAALVQSGREMSAVQIEQFVDEQALKMIQTLVAQRFIERTPGGYRAVASVVDGKLEINGNPMPF